MTTPSSVPFVESKPPKISVVVPLFEEHESVEPLISAIEQTAKQSPWPADQWEVLLVDDGSRDGTSDEVARVVSSRSEQDIQFQLIRFQLIRFRRNRGQTAAMQAGIETSRGEIVVTMDGDLQNDPLDIPQMVKHLESNDLDLVCGIRQKRKDGFVLRKIPSWIANRLIAKMTGLEIKDNGCSLKVFRGDIIRQVRLMGEMHRFIPAWVATVTSPDRIDQVPVRHHARQFGQSKYGLSRTTRVISDLMTVWFHLRYRDRPGHLFGTIAVGLAMMSVVALVVAGYAAATTTGVSAVVAMATIGVVGATAAVVMATGGILAESMTRLHECQILATAEIQQWNGESKPNAAENDDVRRAA